VFPLAGSTAGIEVFTTRPDTLFGATYMVLAPEHPLVAAMTPPDWPQVDGREVPAGWTGGAADPVEAVGRYRSAAGALDERARQAADRAKTGVFTGAFARNPATGEAIPIFVADYVLAGYGTGAIMAVPAHDQRTSSSPGPSACPSARWWRRPTAGTPGMRRHGRTPIPVTGW